MLVKMGADIQGIGSNVLTVHGRDELQGCVHEIAPDHIEIGSFMALAGVTGGELRIKDTVPDDLRMIRLVFDRIGLRTDLDGPDVLVPGDQQLIVQRDAGEFTAKAAFSVWGASKSAVAAIEKAGGSVAILAPKSLEGEAAA